MVATALGQNGLNAVKHVEEVVALGKDHAQTQNRPTEEQIAHDLVNPKHGNHAIPKHVYVRNF